MRRLLALVVLLVTSTAAAQFTVIRRAGAPPAGGIPVIEAYTAQDSGGDVTSMAVVKPSGVTTGDVLILIGIDDETAPEDSPPFTTTITGWTHLEQYGSTGTTGGPNVFVSMWKREADGTEGSTVTVSHIVNSMVAFYFRVSAADIDSIIWSFTDTGTGTGSSHPLPNLTTTVDDCLLIGVLAFDGADNSFGMTGTGWTLTDDAHDGTSGSNSSGAFGEKEAPTAGADTTGVFTASPGDDGSVTMKMAVCAP